jgi:hypothetical protein
VHYGRYFFSNPEEKKSFSSDLPQNRKAIRSSIVGFWMRQRVPNSWIYGEATGTVNVIVVGPHHKEDALRNCFPQVGECWRKIVTSKRQKRETG